MLDKHHARSNELERDLLNVVSGLEFEAAFAESCAGEEFLREEGRKCIKRGETASAKFYGTLASIWKQVREKRFPFLVSSIKAKSN